MKKLSLTVEAADEGERLDRFIAKRGGVSRLEARRLLDRGAVWVDKQRVKIASKAVRRGQGVLVVQEEAGRSAPVELLLSPARILFEDDDVIAVDKPPFVPAQGTLGTDQGNLLTAVTEHVSKPVGLVHRLDIETSGVTIFGKTKRATTALAEAFREGTAKKRYLCAAWGNLPDSVRTELPIKPDERKKGWFIAVEGASLPAATAFKVLARKDSLLAVAAMPETGRTHQIRVHLKALGAPIVGDARYGGPKSLPAPFEAEVPRVLLHARALALPHPSGRPLEVLAPVPDDLRKILDLTGVSPDVL